jgi:hypothetical protein
MLVEYDVRRMGWMDALHPGEVRGADAASQNECGRLRTIEAPVKLTRAVINSCMEPVFQQFSRMSKPIEIDQGF